MSLTDDVRRIAHDEPHPFGDNEQFHTLRDFYERMKAAGLVIHHDYDIPAIDTVGRTGVPQPRHHRQ